MYQKIYQTIQKQGLFDKHKKVLIAVSGGVDSMNLLHFLHLYKKKLAIEIAIAHVNHHQRSESDTEEAYLKKWAEENGLPIFVAHFSGKFSENAAREFRYAFFKKIMKKQSYTALVTAHHADDQAETVFMRLIRGSRLRHLSSMQSVQVFGEGELIRPFLNISKKELPDVFHFEDSSNDSSQYLRNRVRNDYLPTLEKENPQFKQHLQKLGQESQLVFQALNDLTQTIDYQNCQVFLQQTAAVQNILLQNYLDKFSQLKVSKQQFQEMLHLLQTKSNLSYAIKADYYLVKDEQSFEIKKISPKTDGKRLQKVLEYDNIVSYGQYRFSYQATGEATVIEVIPIFDLSPIILRSRQAGDKINFGDFSKKLRRLFIDDKIPSEDRKNAIIAEQKGQIIFVLVAGETYLRKASKHDIMRARLYIEK